MSYPPPQRVPSGPRRRALFASAASAALLAGCSDGGGKPGKSAGGSQSVSRRARALAARESAGMVGRYDAVIATHPQVAGRLAPLRAEVVRHMEAFGGTAAKGHTGTASPSASASASAAGEVSSTPATEKDALAELAAAERALSDRRMAALLEVPGELARLLASVAAAGAAHAYLLTEGAG
ncbi:hypothetical protein ACIRPX_16475 [Streptomyces sp. NPDC101225]|uniref:hypothetical protein n=1 Tax=Streptomyces sp. NPDC101225 TaxID=3366135 RepID=UPI00380DFC08